MLAEIRRVDLVREYGAVGNLDVIDDFGQEQVYDPVDFKGSPFLNYIRLHLLLLILLRQPVLSHQLGIVSYDDLQLVGILNCHQDVSSIKRGRRQQ